MDCKISKSGSILIKRGKEYKTQARPHDDHAHCGDWCPYFNEHKENSVTTCAGIDMELKGDDR